MQKTIKNKTIHFSCVVYAKKWTTLRIKRIFWIKIHKFLKLGSVNQQYRKPQKGKEGGKIRKKTVFHQILIKRLLMSLPVSGCWLALLNKIPAEYVRMALIPLLSETPKKESNMKMHETWDGNGEERIKREMARQTKRDWWENNSTADKLSWVLD